MKWGSLRFDLDLREALGRRLRPDALVVQEDRNLIMSGEAVLDLDAAIGLDAAYLAIAQHRPLPVGRYLLLRNRTGETYWTYKAVVHDFEASPSSRPGHVRRSLTAVMKDAVRRGMTTLAVEPLGIWRRDGLSVEEMVEAFESSVLDFSIGLESSLRIILLLESVDSVEEVSNLVRERLLRRASRSFRTVGDGPALVEIRQQKARWRCRFVPGSLSGYVVTCLEC